MKKFLFTQILLFFFVNTIFSYNSDNVAAFCHPRCHIISGDFSGYYFNVNFRKIFQDKQVQSSCFFCSNFNGIDKEEIILKEIDFSFSNFQYTKFQNVNIITCKFIKCFFHMAHFKNVTFTNNCDLSDTNFSNAHFENVIFDKTTKIKNANFKDAKGLTNEQKVFLIKNGAINVPIQIEYDIDYRDVLTDEKEAPGIIKHLKNRFKSKNISTQTPSSLNDFEK